MRAIFISYRRDDTEGYAGRLFRDLRDRFGKDAVFMDVAGIEPGRDFRRVIEDRVASCGVLLALIGKAWLTVTDDAGKRRLDDPNDFVRLETASALKRDIPVIPVLVQQAEMVRAEQLPDGLKDLAFRNSVELTHARWESDVELLIAALSRYVDPAPPAAVAAPPAVTPAPPPPPRHPAWVIVPLATVALGGVAYIAWDRLGPGSEEAKDRASAIAPMVAASPPAPAPAPALAVAQSPASPASPPSPASAASAAVTAVAPAPAPVREPTTAPRPASAARHVDRPVIAKAAAPPPAYPPAATAETTATRSAPTAIYPSAPPPPAAAVTTAAAPAPAPSPAAEAEPARHDRGLDLLGGAGSPSMVTRTIVIKPDTSYINVTSGDVVRFEVGSRSFIWNFNGTRASFDLAQVAPPALLDRKVTAYVAPNPTFRRR